MPARPTVAIDEGHPGSPPADAPRPRLTAVVPARNESARIGATIADLRRWVDEIVVVDDASDDATGSIAAAAGATVIRSDGRLGYISAVQRGFRAVPGGIVVTVDADGEMPVERIPELVAPIASGAADMVQGHRSAVPRLSERAVSAIASIAGPVGDSGTGFRALRADLARELEIPGSCICGTFTLSVMARGATVAEVAVEARRVPGRRRRIAWNHLGQALLVARMAIRARRRRVRVRTGPA
ncbi:MAG TPA: glycosyltransferase family 2 protein [Candidatus Limnocylindrales bacterium]|nr:glycosyltransferase family 2 protein [Candidatus Limnocylindrales bacterium]